MTKNKKDSDTKAEIRRMSLDLLKGIVEMRQKNFDRIKALYDKDLALLEDAKEKLAIYLGEETT